MGPMRLVDPADLGHCAGGDDVPRSWIQVLDSWLVCHGIRDLVHASGWRRVAGSAGTVLLRFPFTRVGRRLRGLCRKWIPMEQQRTPILDADSSPVNDSTMALLALHMGLLGPRTWPQPGER